MNMCTAIMADTTCPARTQRIMSRKAILLMLLLSWQQEYLLMVGMSEAQQFPPALAAESGECTRTQ